MTTVAEALAEGTGILRSASDSPRADAAILLEAIIKRPRAWIAAYGESEVSAELTAAYRSLCRRRGTGMPAAYLLGTAGFYGLDLLVNEHVLVPRPETEHLVEAAIAFLGERIGSVLDVGTGSGAIACSIAANTRAFCCATDISPAALAVAAENARRSGVAPRCEFFLGELAEPVREHRFDVVVANLPYVPTGEIPRPPNPVAFEPQLAVDGGPDGLALYRRLLPQLTPILEPRSLVLLEAAPSTIEALAALARAALAGFAISTHADYAGLARFVRAERG